MINTSVDVSVSPPGWNAPPLVSVGGGAPRLTPVSAETEGFNMKTKLKYLTAALIAIVAAAAFAEPIGPNPDPLCIKECIDNGGTPYQCHIDCGF